MEDIFQNKAVKFLMIFAIVSCVLGLLTRIFETLDIDTFDTLLKLNSFYFSATYFAIFIYGYSIGEKSLSKRGMILCILNGLLALIYRFKEPGSLYLFDNRIINATYFAIDRSVTSLISIHLYIILTKIIKYDNYNVEKYMRLYIVCSVISLLMSIIDDFAVDNLGKFYALLYGIFVELKSLFISLSFIYCFIKEENIDIYNQVATINQSTIGQGQTTQTVIQEAPTIQNTQQNVVKNPVNQAPVSNQNVINQ